MTTNVEQKREVVDFRQMTKDLLIQWLDGKAYLSSKHKFTLFKLGSDGLDDVSILYQINKAVLIKQNLLIEADSKLALSFENDMCILTEKEEKLEFEVSQLREVISGMIDITEKILPLGTVVDLNVKYLQKHVPVNEVKNVRVVITHRFLYDEDHLTYFPYAGVIYPVGMFEKKGFIHFTPSLIESVVHTGYSDIQDKAYIYMMKREVILEKGMHSFGFSTEEERSKFENRLKLEGKKYEIQS